MEPKKGGTSTIQIRPSDLKDNCNLLNRRLDLMDGLIEEALEKAAAAVAAAAAAATATATVAAASSATSIFAGLHIDKAALSPADYLESLYVETDRGNVVYQARAVGWVFVSGQMQAVFADRPSDLLLNDAGFLFTATDSYKYTYRWSGAAWDIIEVYSDFVSVIKSGGDAVSDVESYGGQAVFSGITARGTFAAPTAVQLNDEIVKFGGRAYGATGFSSDYRVAVIGKAAENWTDTAQGTYATVEVTPVGSATRVEVARYTSVGLGVGRDPAYRVDIVESSASQVHLNNSSADTGLYLRAIGNDNAYFIGGATHVAGTGWIAKHTSAAIIESSGGSVGIYTDTGLTIGNTYTPTKRVTINATGLGVGVTPLTSLESAGSISSIGYDTAVPATTFIRMHWDTVSLYGDVVVYDPVGSVFKPLVLRGIPINLCQGNVSIGGTPATVPAYPLDVIGDINTSTLFRVAGAPGVTVAAANFIISVTPSYTTIQYKDWAGANQSISVMTGLGSSAVSHAWTGGVLTT